MRLRGSNMGRGEPNLLGDVLEYWNRRKRASVLTELGWALGRRWHRYGSGLGALHLLRRTSVLTELVRVLGRRWHRHGSGALHLRRRTGDQKTGQESQEYSGTPGHLYLKHSQLFPARQAASPLPTPRKWLPRRDSRSARERCCSGMSYKKEALPQIPQRIGIGGQSPVLPSLATVHAGPHTAVRRVKLGVYSQAFCVVRRQEAIRSLPGRTSGPPPRLPPEDQRILAFLPSLRSRCFLASRFTPLAGYHSGLQSPFPEWPICCTAFRPLECLNILADCLTYFALC